MATHSHRNREPVSRAGLWFGLLAGAISWSLRLLISYPLVPVVCEQGTEFLLHLVSGGFLLITLLAVFVAWRSYRAARDLDATEAAGTDPWTAERVAFMARLGMLASSLFALVILAEWATVFFVDPCISR